MNPTCSVSRCDRPVKSRGWCQMHYFRWRRGGDMNAEPLARHTHTDCLLEDCSKDRSKGTPYCSMHAARLYRNGSPEALRGPNIMHGPNNPAWKGDDVGYGSAHERLRRRRGAPEQCEHCSEAEGPFHWALNWFLGGEEFLICSSTGLMFSTNPESYLSLCVPCHKRFDLDHARTPSPTPPTQ